MTTSLEPRLSPAGLELAIIHSEAQDALATSLARRGVKMDDLPSDTQEGIIMGIHAGISAALDYTAERFNR